MIKAIFKKCENEKFEEGKEEGGKSVSKRVCLEIKNKSNG